MERWKNWQELEAKENHFAPLPYQLMSTPDRLENKAMIKTFQFFQMSCERDQGSMSLCAEEG